MRDSADHKVHHDLAGREGVGHTNFCVRCRKWNRLTIVIEASYECAHRLGIPVTVIAQVKLISC